MERSGSRAIISGYIKYAVLPWAILFSARYLYYYGFQYAGLSIIADERFIVDSIMQFVVFSGLYAMRFAKSK